MILDPVSLLNLGNSAFTRGQFRLALSHYLKGLESIEENPDLKTDFYGNIGNVYAASGEYDAAVLYYQKVVEIFRREENYARLGTTFVNIGNVYADQNKNDLAEQFYMKGALLLEQERQFNELSTLYGNLSLLSIARKDLAGGLEHAENALKFAKTMNDPIRIAEAFHAMARIHMHLGELRASLSFSESAYSLFARHHHEYGIAMTLFHQTGLFEKLGDLESAIRALEEVVRIDEKYHLPKLAENRARLLELNRKIRSGQ